MNSEPNSSRSPTGFNDPATDDDHIELVVNSALDISPKGKCSQNDSTGGKATEIESAKPEATSHPTTSQTAPQAPTKKVKYTEAQVLALAGVGLTLFTFFDLGNQNLMLANFVLVLFAIARLHMLIAEASDNRYPWSTLRAVLLTGAAFALPVIIVAVFASFPAIAASLKFLLFTHDTSANPFLSFLVVTPGLFLSVLWLNSAITLTDRGQPPDQLPKRSLLWRLTWFSGILSGIGSGYLMSLGVPGLLAVGFILQYLFILFVCDRLDSMKPEYIKRRALRMSQRN
jgi:hypothetical protein